MKSEERRGKSGSGGFAAWSFSLFCVDGFLAIRRQTVRRQTVRRQKSDSIWREAPESDGAGARAYPGLTSEVFKSDVS